MGRFPFETNENLKTMSLLSRLDVARGTRRIGLATSLVAALLTAGHASADELSVATFVPPQHHTNVNGWEWFGKELAELTDGELTVRVYPAGQLGAGPTQQYKRVVEGVADAVLGVAGYTPELFPVAMLTVPPGTASTSDELAQAFLANWDEHFAAEFDEVVFLGIGFNAGVSIAANRDLSTLESWKGAKIVAFSASMGPLLEAMGAVPVQMPVTDIYTALSTGTIDGAVAAHNNMLAPWNWHEAASHYIDNVPPQFQTVYFVMNKERYQSLPEAHRAAIDELRGARFTASASGGFQKADQAALDTFRDDPERGFEYVVVSDEERAKMDAAVAEGLEVIFDEYEQAGVANAREIYNDLHGLD